MKGSKVYLLRDDEFIELVKSCRNYSDILVSLGLTPRGGNSSKILKRRIAELKIDTSHFLPKTAKASFKITKNLNDILVKDSDYANIYCLKIRLVKDGMLEYRCSICGNNGKWNGKKLCLQLDHINGQNNDHRVENLRFLCPNCHSQTNTYAGKNKS